MYVHVGSENMPNSIIDKPSFRNVIAALNPRYIPPGKVLLAKEIDKLYSLMCDVIKGHLSSATAVHFTTDLWTKKGLTSSYFGVTAHFSHVDGEYHSVLLAMRNIKELHHTAAVVADLFKQVVTEWNVSSDQVRFVVTDNGSNIVKAFRDDFFRELAEAEESESDDTNTDNEDEEEMVDDDTIIDTIDEDVVDFDTCDSEHAQQFEEVGYGKRLSCYAHTIQLVVTSFNKDPYVRSLVTEVYRVVKKVNSSAVATGKLLRLCNKKLLSHCPTRWSSTFLVLQRLLEVKEPLIQVLQEMEWDCTITVSKWKVLSSMMDLLHPFAESTNLLSGEKYATIGSVVVDIMDISLHLDTFVKSKDTPKQLIPVANVMKAELNRRFGKYTDPTAVDCDPTYLMALLLNPAEAILLNEEQIKCASKELKRYMERSNLPCTSEAEYSAVSSHSPSPSPQEGSDQSDNSSNSEPRSKHHRRFVHKIIQQRATDLKRKASSSPIDIQIKKYVHKVKTNPPPDVEPLKYWMDRYQRNKDSVLSAVAIDVLTATASSAPAERVFSIAGEVVRGKRNRLQKYNLEREVLLRKNERYIPIIDSPQ